MLIETHPNVNLCVYSGDRHRLEDCMKVHLKFLGFFLFYYVLMKSLLLFKQQHK